MSLTILFQTFFRIIPLLSHLSLLFLSGIQKSLLLSRSEVLGLDLIRNKGQTGKQVHFHGILFSVLFTVFFPNLTSAHL